MLSETDDIRLVQGLIGQDDHIPILLTYWQEFQSSSAEAAEYLDFFSFVENTLYFALIFKKPAKPALGEFVALRVSFEWFPEDLPSPSRHPRTFFQLREI